MKYSRKFKPRKMNLKKKRTYKRKATKLAKPLKVIQRAIENKQAFTSSNATFFNSGIDSAGDMIQIIPNIAKSVNENGRIGNQICAKSLKIKGFLRFLPQSNTTVNTTHYGHVGIRIMILTLKSAGNYTSALQQSSSLNSLLQKGGTTVAFTGAISDLYAPINRELFTVHFNKVYYVTQSYVFTGDNITNPKVAIDVSKLVKFFNINIKCKNKILKYDSALSSDLLPSNLGMFLCAGYTYMNGDAPDSLTTNLQLSYDVIFDYEDA